jgi:hypothetical protein
MLTLKREKPVRAAGQPIVGPLEAHQFLMHGWMPRKKRNGQRLKTARRRRLMVANPLVKLAKNLRRRSSRLSGTDTERSSDCPVLV